jgi:integrase
MRLEPYIPEDLLREPLLLTVYCAILRHTSTEPRKVLVGGRVVQLAACEACLDAKQVASVVNQPVDDVERAILTLCEVGHLSPGSVPGRCIVGGGAQQASGPSTPVVEERKGVKVSAFLTDYLAYVKATFAHKTYLNADRVVRHFVRVAGERMIDSLTAEDLEKYKQMRLESVSPTTVNIDIRTLKAAFEVAVTWERLFKNPFKPVMQVRVNATKKKALTREELQRVYDSIQLEWFRPIVRFAAGTGLRLGELPNLRWTDYNSKTGFLIVQSSKHYRVKGGKMRTIAVHETLRAMLDTMPKGSDLIFPRPDGSAYSGSWLSQLFKRHVRASGLSEDLHFHSLRHTFGTHAAEDGMSVHILRDCMGHSSIRVTEMYLSGNAEQMTAQIGKLKLAGSGV